jgi:hypothetical protein
MVRLDTESIRARAHKTWRKAQKAFELDDAQLKTFERQEILAFERWKHQQLGPLLAELMQADRELDEAEYHLAMAEEERWRTGQPLWRAFMTWQQNEERRRKSPPPLEDDCEDPKWREILKEELKDSPLGDLADELGIDLDDIVDENFEHEEPPRPRGRGAFPHRAKPAGISASLREIYRKLCRLLHPDAAGELTVEQREIWHQVQEAYRAGDVARLDTLLARVEQGEGGHMKPRTIADILALARHYQRARQQLRSLLAQARRHPAWNFLKRTVQQREILENQLRAELDFHLFQVRQRLTRIRSLLAPRGKRRPERAMPYQREFGF